MRYLVGAIALAPFVLLLLAMTAGRARVQPCCAPTASPGESTRARPGTTLPPQL